MRRLSLLLFVVMCFGTPVIGEELGVIEIAPRAEKTFRYKSDVPQVFNFQVKEAPLIAEKAKGLDFGVGNKLGTVFCEGPTCSKAGGSTMFCPVAGQITGRIKNYSDGVFKITLKRIECEGKDRDEVSCPKRVDPKNLCG